MGLFYNSTLTEILARVTVLFTAITIHEYAHGFMAYKLGDPTAKYSGRLTLNPIKHLDPFGAVCMALFSFGWAKPVPVNPMYFKNRKRDNALVALAGPVANILLAFLSAFIVALYDRFLFAHLPLFLASFLESIFVQLAILNIGFAVFNLIPFPPLDGSKILAVFIPDRSYNKLLMFEHFGFPIIMILSFTGLLGRILDILRIPLINLWFMLANWFLSIL